MGTASVHQGRLAVALALLALVGAALLARAPASAADQLSEPANSEVVPGKLVVGFDKSASRSLQRTTVAKAGATIEDDIHSIDSAVVAAKPGQSTDAIADQLSRSDAVAFVEPDYVVKAARLPNDVLLHELWGLRNTGQLGGKPGADINAPAAWDVTTGGDVTVAVVDTGIDYGHPDLRNNMWVNPADPPNGVDDDHNGFVDDVHGIDLVNGDSDPADDSSHGTHVAGIIGAEGNNGLGTTGVNWKVHLMALKFLNANGSGNTEDAAKAIDYAVKEGARVINASWGGPAYSFALYRAIKAAASKDVIVVAAAGNDGGNADNSPEYPAAFDLPNVVSVAATDSQDRLANFSNYGSRTVDLGAPGDEIYSTVPPQFGGGGYLAYSGTSMATPFVSGAAALYLSRTPSAPFTQVRDALLQSVDPLPSLAGKTVSGGRLNVGRMLGITGPVDIPQPAPRKGAAAPAPFSLIAPRNRYKSHRRGVRFHWQRSRDGSGIHYYKLYVDGRKRKTIKDPDGPGGGVAATKVWCKVRGGRHRWFVRAYDYAGKSRKSRVSHRGGRASRVLLVGRRS